MTGARGASAALRGYRLQLLYTLHRLLNPVGSEGQSLRPEGVEDLDILDHGVLCETIQVKSYEALTLSQLDPGNPNSFFRRAVQLATSDPQLQISLVNFGEIGPELRGAWDGLDAQQNVVERKLHDAGFAAHEIQTLFQRVKLLSVKEALLRGEILAFLRDTPLDIDPLKAFDLLIYWLYCQAEASNTITYKESIDRISDIGQALAAQQAHQREWFTSILPLSQELFDASSITHLENEFFAGVATRPEHIFAELDFPRPEWLAKISAGFDQANVVIVHAASGQGKTALAYRYLIDTYPSTWCFRIDLIQDRHHALSIARALAGHANAVQAPMAIYIDVSPRDTDWPELVQRLAANRYFHILVSIREDDLRRAMIPGGTFTYVDVALTFDKSEALDLFNRGGSSIRSKRFLDFEDAWAAFGDRGPLLEFMYLLTQTDSLRDRLHAQITTIRHEIRVGQRPAEELRLLQLIAVATAYEGRVSVAALEGSLSLSDLPYSLSLFEQEYLVRLSADKRFIEALHPLRSQIITTLVLDPTLSPWIQIAAHVIPLLEERDLEGFLLRSFIDHPDETASLLGMVQSHHWQSWTGLAGVLQAQLWACVHGYVEAQHVLIQEAYTHLGQAWWFAINLDVMGLVGNPITDMLSLIDGYISDNRRELITRIQAEQTSKEGLFDTVKEWLSAITFIPTIPILGSDWQALAFVWWWMAHLNIPHITTLQVSDDGLDTLHSHIDLEVWADVSFSLFTIAPERHARWISRHLPYLHQLLAHEYDILSLQNQDQTLTIHYLLDEQNLLSTRHTNDAELPVAETSNSLHAETMRRLQVIRQLFPSYAAYGARAYGHTLGDAVPLEYDESRKDAVKADALLPRRMMALNAVAHNLAVYPFRPNSWSEFVNSILAKRQQTTILLQQLTTALRIFAQQGSKKGKTDVFKRNISFDLWSECDGTLSVRSLLPKNAVDPWGFDSEGKAQNLNASPSQHSAIVRYTFSSKKYKSYYLFEQKYTSSLTAFLRNGLIVLWANHRIAHLQKGTAEYNKAMEDCRSNGYRENTNHLSAHSLVEAVNCLHNFQQQFQKFFGSIIDTDLLEEITTGEQKVLSQLWPLWYMFAYNPGQRWSDPLRQIPAQINHERIELHRRIKHGCDRVIQHGVRVSILNGIGHWDSEPTVWIQLDVDNPLDIHTKFGELILSLRMSLGEVDYTSLLSYIIDDNARYIAIIPSIGGTLFDQQAHKLSTRMTIMRDGDPNDKGLRWKFIPQTIPEDNWQHLDIRIVQSEDLVPLNQLVTETSILYVLIARLASFEGIPDMTDEGFIVLQRFVAEQAALVSKHFNGITQALSSIKAIFNTLSSEEMLTKPKWREVIEALDELLQNVRPTRGSTDQYQLRMDDLSEYQDRLESAATMAVFMRLYWLAELN